MDLSRSINLRNMFARCAVTKKKSRKNDAGDNIRIASESLKMGHINVLEFLENIALFKEKKNEFASYKWLQMLNAEDEIQNETAKRIRSEDCLHENDMQPAKRTRSRVESINLCKSCNDNETNVVFMPCTHAVMCSACWSTREKVDKSCFECHALVMCHIEFRT